MLRKLMQPMYDNSIFYSCFTILYYLCGIPLFVLSDCVKRIKHYGYTQQWTVKQNSGWLSVAGSLNLALAKDKSSIWERGLSASRAGSTPQPLSQKGSEPRRGSGTGTQGAVIKPEGYKMVQGGCPPLM